MGNEATLTTRAARLSALEDILQDRALHPHFMPILDALSGSIIAYEVVVRGEGILALPEDLFPAALELGMSLELEKACLQKVIETIAALPETQRNRWKFFVNVGSPSLLEPTFRALLNPADLLAIGIAPETIVLEVTDKERVTDTAKFEHAIREMSRKGFRVALDQFGTGQSSLLDLVTALPSFIKLDRGLVSKVEDEGYVQLLIRSLAQFSANVDTRFIAEGVERWEQLDALARLGVRFVQGGLFGLPQPELTFPTKSVVTELQRRARRLLLAHKAGEESVACLAIRTAHIRAATKTCEQIDSFFLENPHEDHVVILKSEKPVALITRAYLYANLSGPTGWGLMAHRQVDSLAKPAPLIVSDSADISTVAQTAMNRLAEDSYDPIIVIDQLGAYVGTVSVKAILTRTLDLEVRRARETNPLTGLPGNRVVEEWIADAFTHPEGSIAYVDMTAFREYNEQHGFQLGDELIQRVARMLAARFPASGADRPRLAHVGGDDFVVVSRQRMERELFTDLLLQFDQGCASFSPAVHLTVTLLYPLKVTGARRLNDLSRRAAAAKSHALSLSSKQRRSLLHEDP
jgi:EAL domain-containing protein (putative c-di-GMP-specific phosphodiesterase class I)/GGDEF domain-containing protein